MKTLPPKEHPTFKRAMGLAHKRLMNERSKLSKRVDELVAQGVADPKEAGSIALAELAQRAYEDAVDTLASECSRRARIEYSMSGEAYVDDAIAQISARGDKSNTLIAKALKSARKAMPEQVRCVHEFGLREDGLIFGSTKNFAVGGSFEALQTKVRKAMEQAALSEAKRKIKDDGAEDLVAELAPRLLAAMAPTLRAIAERSFPSDKAAQGGRALCARAADLAEKISKLDHVIISCDNEANHVVTGPQAKARILSLSGEADSERPDAGSISEFFLKLGV